MTQQIDIPQVRSEGKRLITPTDGPFEKPKRPFKVGMLYSRTWQAPFVNGVTKLWAERTEAYWERIERRFGVVFTDHRNAYDEVTSTITTFASPLYIVPGKRFVPGARSERSH